MDKITVFPDIQITSAGVVSDKFLSLGITTFIDACRKFRDFPYGYNSSKDDLMIVFKENMGTCTTKHSVIATLAEELDLPVTKTICIYAMNEEIVTGTNAILEKYQLPYVPMVHCFLEYQRFKVDLTEDNNNGKNRSIEEFLYTEKVNKTNLPNYRSKHHRDYKEDFVECKDHRNIDKEGYYNLSNSPKY